MELLYFAIFVVLNHFFLSFLIQLSTLFSTFWQNYVLMISYGVISAFLFFRFIYPSFFVYFLVVAAIILSIKGFVTFRMAKNHIDQNYESFLDLEEIEKYKIVSSLSGAKKEFTIVIFIYLVTFSIAYIYFFNQ